MHEQYFHSTYQYHNNEHYNYTVTDKKKDRKAR